MGGADSETDIEPDCRSNENDICDEQANVSDAETDSNEDNEVLESLGQSRHNLKDHKQLRYRSTVTSFLHA